MFENGVRILEDLSYNSFNSSVETLGGFVFLAGIVTMIGSIVTCVFYFLHLGRCEGNIIALRDIEDPENTDKTTKELLDSMVCRTNLLRNFCFNNTDRMTMSLCAIIIGSIVISISSLWFGYTYCAKGSYPSTITHKYRVEITGFVPAELLETYEIMERCGDNQYIIRELMEEE